MFRLKDDLLQHYTKPSVWLNLSWRAHLGPPQGDYCGVEDLGSSERVNAFCDLYF